MKSENGKGAVDRIGRRCQVFLPYASLIFIHSVILADFQLTNVLSARSSFSCLFFLFSTVIIYFIVFFFYFQLTQVNEIYYIKQRIARKSQ